MTTSLNIPIQAIATFTAKGKRPVQEDYIIADKNRSLFIVADGFGGPGPGSMASKTACESVKQFLFKEAGDLEATLPFILRRYFSLAGNVLFNSLVFANNKLNELNKNKNIHEKGGASVLAGFVDGDLLALANVGVCQGWLIREGKSSELVIPRSFGRVVDPFSPVSASEFQVPMIALGMYEDLEPEIVEYRLKTGDWLVLATDGIGDQMIQQVEAFQRRHMSPEMASEELNRCLNNLSFSDNASILLVLF